MGEANVTNATSGVIAGAQRPRKPGKLKFGQRVLLLAGIIALGGAPSYLMIRGSVPEQRGGGTPVVMNTPENAARVLEPCKVGGELKPTMNLNRAKE